MLENEEMSEIIITVLKRIGPLSLHHIQECADEAGEDLGRYILNAIAMRMKKERNYDT